MTEQKCMCSDPGCPACKGYCNLAASTVVYRTDMEDESGSPMCTGCAVDAMESGVFTDEAPGEDDAEEIDLFARKNITQSPPQR